MPDTDDNAARLRGRARAMRATTPPATYAEIARALHVSRSTAYRYANPSAEEADRLAQAARRADPERKPAIDAYEKGRLHGTCERCGARTARGKTLDPVCRQALKHQALAARVLNLVRQDDVAPTAPALQHADPSLKSVRLGLLIRQLRAVGALEPGRTGPVALDHPELVDQIIAAQPTDLTGLPYPERERIVMAAGARLASL